LIATIVQLSALIAAGLVLLTLAWYRAGWVIFIMISAAAVLDLFEIKLGSAGLGVNVYFDDVALVVLLLTCFLAILQYRKNFPRDATPCLMLMVLIVLSFSRGISTYGLKAAGNSARNLLTFTTPALAIMLSRPVFRLDASRLARWLVWAGSCLCMVVLLRWAGVLPTPVDLQENARLVNRAIGADHAIIIGQAFIAAIYLPLVKRRSAWWWVGAGVLGGIIFALQHRSVWVASVIGVTWLILRHSRRSIGRTLAIGAAACAVLGVITLASPWVLQTTGQIATTNAEEVLSKNSSWAWRVQGYEEATGRLFESDFVDISIGPPAGWAADSNLSFASTHIHSRYVDTLAYYGVVGFAVLLLWFWVLAKRVGWPARSIRGMASPNNIGTIFLEALLLSEVVYLVPYFGGILEGTVLGLIWVAAKQNWSFSAARRVALVRYQFDRRNRPATLAS
jgi:hypothetical protein